MGWKQKDPVQMKRGDGEREIKDESNTSCLSSSSSIKSWSRNVEIKKKKRFFDKNTKLKKTRSKLLMSSVWVETWGRSHSEKWNVVFRHNPTSAAHNSHDPLLIHRLHLRDDVTDLQGTTQRFIFIRNKNGFLTSQTFRPSSWAHPGSQRWSQTEPGPLLSPQNGALWLAELEIKRHV